MSFYDDFTGEVLDSAIWSSGAGFSAANNYVDLTSNVLETNAGELTQEMFDNLLVRLDLSGIPNYTHHYIYIGEDTAFYPQFAQARLHIYSLDPGNAYIALEESSGGYTDYVVTGYFSQSLDVSSRNLIEITRDISGNWNVIHNGTLLSTVVEAETYTINSGVGILHLGTGPLQCYYARLSQQDETFRYGGGNSVGVQGSSLTIGSTLTIAAGDLIVVYINNDAIDNGLDAPDGTWNEVSTINVSGETATEQLFWKIAGDGETSYTFTSGSSTSSYRRAIIKQFKVPSGKIPSVVTALDGFYQSDGSRQDLVITATTGQSLATEELALIFAGKDNRSGSSTPFTTIDNNFAGVLGDVEHEVTGGSHKLAGQAETLTETTITGNVIADGTYSRILTFELKEVSVQPTGDAEINPAHPLAADCSFFMLGATGQDAVSGEYGTFEHGAVLAPSVEGGSIHFPTGSTGADQNRVKYSVAEVGGGPVTLISRAYSNDTAPYYARLMDARFTNDGYLVSRFGPRGWNIEVGSAATTTGQYYRDDNVWVNAAHVFDGTNVSVYRDWSLLTQLSIQAPSAVKTNPTIGHVPQFADHAWNGYINYVIEFNRVLTGAEIQSVIADPFALVRSTSASVPTATPPQGTLGFTGLIPTPSAQGGNAVVEAIVGLTTLVGTIPSVAITGGAVVAEVPSALLDITGWLPTVNASGGQVVSEVPTGIFTLDGTIPVISAIGGNVTANIPTGELVGIGLIPSASANGGQVVAEPLAGSSSLTGLIATAIAQGGEVAVQPASANAAITGLIPTPYAFNAYVVVQAVTGVLNTAGLLPTASAGGGIVSVTIPNGITGITGLTPTALAEGGFVTVQVPLGQFNITGQVPITGALGGNVIAEVSLNGTINAEGLVPTAEAGGGLVTVQIPLNTLSIDGSTPLARAEGGYVFSIPQTGLLSAVGITPNARIGSPPSIGYFAGSLVIKSAFDGKLDIF